jgi:DNA-binding MarR family transcriptional regulator
VEQPHDTAAIAVSLAVAVARFRSRLREEAGIGSTGLSITQLAVVGRVIKEGPTTAAALSAAEHVSQQAIGQTLQALKRGGLVRAKPDPNDGRKSLIVATPEARRLHATLYNAREAWLNRALDATLDDSEKATLLAAIELLERLASAPTR